MHVLLLGGTSLTGPHIVHRLIEHGHHVTVFHRGQTPAHLPSSVPHILGNRQHLASFTPVFRQLAPDIVIDMLAFTREDAQMLLDVFHGLTGRVVVASSIDVYRAFGRLHGTEPGPPDPVPLSEDAPLRERLSLHGRDYEKRWVEEVVMSDAALPATVLRFPAIYGAGDARPFDYLKRMDDRRPAILLDRQKATFRFSRGSARNVAAVVVCAVLNERAAHRVYNVADTDVLTELAWAHMIAKVAGWNGQFVMVDGEQLPAHLKQQIDWRQDWVVDTTRIRQELGYTDIETPLEGVQAAVKWLRVHPPTEVDPARFDYQAEDSVLHRAA